MESNMLSKHCHYTNRSSYKAIVSHHLLIHPRTSSLFLTHKHVAIYIAIS